MGVCGSKNKKSGTPPPNINIKQEDEDYNQDVHQLISKKEIITPLDKVEQENQIKLDEFINKLDDGEEGVPMKVEELYNQGKKITEIRGMQDVLDNVSNVKL